jgi:hypothetical protein
VDEVFGSEPYGTLQGDCAASNGNVVCRGYVGIYEQELDGVMLGSVGTHSSLFLIIGANSTHYFIDLMLSAFAHLNGTGNFT